MPSDRAIYEQFRGEMRKARERILTTADGEVGWLLKFIQTDLDTLTASEWMVVAFEVASFVDDVANARGAEIATEAGWSVRSIPGDGSSGTLPSRGEAKEIQAMILGSLEKLWETAVTAFTFPQFTIIVTLPLENERRGCVFVATKRKVKEFEYRFAHLLVDYSGRIRRCPECQRIYLAIRFDQRYCGPRCQTRVATRKWREGHKADQQKEHRRGKKSGKG